MTDGITERAPLRIEILTSQTVVWCGLQNILKTSVTVPMVLHLHHRRTRGKPLAELSADVFILDLESERDAVGTIKQIRASAPSSKIVLLCGLDDADRVREAVTFGVDGIILVVQPAPVVLAAIEALFSPASCPLQSGQADAVGMGLIDYTVDVETLPLDWPQTLTKREQEIVLLVRQGLSNKDIASALSISDSTVRHHMTNIFQKIGVPNRQKLIVHTHRLYSIRPGAHEYHPTIG
jgi:DNA-binding NarL/FixJ family response regulator